MRRTIIPKNLYQKMVTDDRLYYAVTERDYEQIQQNYANKDKFDIRTIYLFASTSVLISVLILITHKIKNRF